jgi:glycosyltransferase involved in cell wall biosynthesis
MKISMIIPCKMDHVDYLKEAIDNILIGSKKPDELFIFVSGVDPTPINKDKLKSIYEYVGEFSKFVVSHCEKKYSYAKAKNHMASSCKGDLIVTHDADDIQHPQRLEVIEHFFKTRDIVHLNHAFVYYDQKWENFDIEKCKLWESQELYNSMIENTGQYGHMGAYGHPFCRRIVDGSMAFKREVFDKVQWPETHEKGMDKEFCFSILKEFNNSLLIDVPLYKWRKKH